MSAGFCTIDDKDVPFCRVLWIAAVPHYCGSDECLVEGHYEVRLEPEESVWASREERDQALSSLEAWQNGSGETGGHWE